MIISLMFLRSVEEERLDVEFIKLVKSNSKIEQSIANDETIQLYVLKKNRKDAPTTQTIASKTYDSHIKVLEIP